MKRKFQCAIVGLFAMMLAGDGVGTHVIALAGGEKEIETEETGETKAGETGFVAEGTTQVSTVSQEISFSADECDMTVEEVYVESGDTVSKGDALYRINEDGIQQAIAYYEKMVETAARTLESAEIAYESGKLEAEADRDEKQLQAENAKAAYEASLSELEIKVEEKQEAYDSAVEEIISSKTALEDGTYETQFGIEEKQQAYDVAESSLAEAEKKLAEAQSAYDAQKQLFETDLTELKSQMEAGAEKEDLMKLMTETFDAYNGMQTLEETLGTAQSNADMASSDLEKANMSLTTAQREYDAKVEEVNQKVTELTEKLESLNEEYEQAKRDAVTKKAEIQKTYEKAVLEGKYATAEYSGTISELQDTLDEAQDALTELQEEQNRLLAVEDGIIRAEQDGTIAAIGYETGDILREQIALVSYYDTGTIFISVEVSQENIAEVAVGDAVGVAITGMRQGTIDGTVDSIASSKTTGGSMSNVTYAVVISVDNREGKVSSGSSVTVTFGYSKADEDR